MVRRPIRVHTALAPKKGLRALPERATGDWLCAHRRHEHPHVGKAIMDFARVANREQFMGKLFPFLQGKGDLVYVGKNESVARKTLAELERLVMQDDYGLETAVMQVAARNPYLAEVLTDAQSYEDFVENQVNAKKWKESLRAMGRSKNGSLRAVSLLLFLRTHHKGKPVE